MAQYAILTDLNRCNGCLGCVAHCKAANGVKPGDFWTKVLRIGPTPTEGGSGDWPDVEYYFLPMQCQHCANPECVNVCPTGASQKMEDGTIQIDAETCIGCQACVAACPYGVRYLNQDTLVVEKCNLCKERVEQDQLPMCVAQCGSRAKYFDIVEDGLGTFKALAPTHDLATSYEDMINENRTTAEEWLEPWTDEDVHQLTDFGNGPSFYYILRNRKWQALDGMNLSEMRTADTHAFSPAE